MAILNYTTKIDSYKTITEIQKILSVNGANKVIVDNDSAGNPIAITFCIIWQGEQTGYSLPCNFSGVLKKMKASSKVPKSLQNEAQALRVGWRIIKDWIEAQMAIVQANLADLAEIFLPYAILKSGDTLYKHIKYNTGILLN